ncbi:MAG: hypothetical protein GX809_01470 [Clostridiaceae bacterium]|nr:hypothetical protein [Clostridiaceae bacterium]
MKKKTRNTWMKGAKTITTFILVAVLLTLIPGVVKADKSKDLVMLANGSASKREVVFAKLDASGQVEQIYVVNHFHPQKKVNLIDYGDYESVTQLTGETAPVLSGSQIDIKDVEGHYYYQGNLKSRELPWTFDIIYRLDGIARTVDSLSGVKGKLEINLGIKQNGLVDTSFIDQYALQISIPIDPDRAVLLGASQGGVVSYAGSTHQLTYIVLPGSETVIKVLLDVEDFAMDQIVIAGVPLSFDMDLSELESELDPLEELTDGIAQLNKGAQRLNEGYKELLQGYQVLIDGSQQLTAGGKELKSGSSQIKDGLNDYAAGISQYAEGVKDLSSGYGQFDQGLQDLRSGASTLYQQGQGLKKGSADVLAGLNAIVNQLPEDLSGFEFSKEQLDQLDELLQGAGLLKNNLPELQAGASQLAFGLNKIKVELDEIPAGANIPDLDQAQWLHNLTEKLGLTQEQAGQLVGTLVLASSYQQIIDQIPAFAGGATSLSKGIDDLVMGFNGYVDNGVYHAGLYDGLEVLVNQIKSMAAGSGALLEDFGQLASGLVEMRDGYAELHYGLGLYVNDGVGGIVTGLGGDKNQPGLVGASSEVRQGLDQLGSGGAALGQAGTELGAGMSELNKGIANYVDGVSGLKDGLVKYRLDGLVPYSGGLDDYTAGMGELKDQTSDLKEQFMEALEDRLAEFTGEDFEVRSFVSDRNTDVVSVQFVLMTEEIPPLES